MFKKIMGTAFLLGSTSVYGQIPAGAVSAVTATSPIVTTTSGTRVNVTCPTCGAGGTSVGTAGQLQMVGSTAGSFAASHVTDDGASVNSSEAVVVTGLLGANQTNAVVFDFFSGAGRLFAYGPNTSTAGDVSLLGASTDASTILTYMSCVHTNGVCAFSQTPTATTQAVNTNNTSLATTAFVATQIAASSPPSLKATTPSIGGSALTAGCTNQTAVTVTGATTAMACVMSGVAGNPTGVQPQCSVSAANTVIPQLCTAVVAGVTPTAQTYNIRVIQ